MKEQSPEVLVIVKSNIPYPGGAAFLVVFMVDPFDSYLLEMINSFAHFLYPYCYVICGARERPMPFS